MQKKHVTQTESKAGGFKWLNLLAGCVVPLAVVAGCNGSDDDGGPSPLPTNTPSATSPPTAAPTPTSISCGTGTGTAAFRTVAQGNFNPAAVTNGCASGTQLSLSGRVNAVTLLLQDTIAGQKRTLILLLNDGNGLQINRNYKTDVASYSETLLSNNTSRQWKSENGIVVIDAITTTSIRYHFQGTFTPGTLTEPNLSPGTGSFTLTGRASSALTRG